MPKTMRVLLVDDDEDEYILLKDHLRHMPASKDNISYTLDWVDNLNAAMEVSQHHEYDLYLVDYYLGEHTGLELMREWSAQGSSVPVVLLTGQGNYEVDLAAMQHGASDYLVKSQLGPFVLERVFRYTLERKRAKNELEERVRERTQELAEINAYLQAEISARKRVEAELRASEQRLRVLAETTSAAIFIVHNETIRYANTAAQYVTGYTPQELTGTPFWKLAHAAYQDGLRRRGLIKQWYSGLPARFELKLITKDGQERWVDITAGEMDYDGQPASIITAFDITERDRAEKELQLAKTELETRVEQRTSELVRANLQLQEVLTALENEQARLRTIIENAPGGIVVANSRGRIILANPMAEQILGTELPADESSDELLHFQLCRLDGTPLSSQETIIWRSAVLGETISDQELLLFRADGQRRYILSSATPIVGSKGAQSGAIVIFQDITQRKQREHEIQENGLRAEVLSTMTEAFAQAGLDYEAVLNTIAWKIIENLADGCIIRLVSDDGDWLNPVAARYRNPETSEEKEFQHNLLRDPVNSGLLGRIFTTGEPLALLQTDQGTLKRLLRPETYALFSGLGVCSLIILPLRAQDRTLGTLTFFRCQPKEPYGERDMAFFTDLTYRAALAIENAMLHEQVKQLAMRDSLTGQYNRRAFFDLGRDEVNTHHDRRQPLAAIMLDIDHFKVINDTYGHALGDDVLRMVIDFCRENIRHTDILGRYGGDEYVILLPRTNLTTAARIASRICKTISNKPFETKAGRVPVTVSLGVTEADSHTQNIQELLDLADKALYHAKQKGRNRVETIPTRAKKQG